MNKKYYLFLFCFSLSVLAKAQFPYYETFKHSNAPGMVIGGSARLTAAAGLDAEGEGYLRLTDAVNANVGYIYSQKTFPSYYGITASYEFFTYKDVPTNQADGFTFFLYDAGVNTFRPGAFGGALGYAQRNYNGVLVPGLGKGFIGIGVDEYGNYSTNVEGKSGVSATLIPSSIVVRGPGDGTVQNSDYLYKAGVSCSTAPHTASSFLGFTKRYPDSADVHYRRVKFILTPGSSLSSSQGYTITVILYRGSGVAGTPVIPDTLISNLDYPYIAPPFLKYGLAGSTGGATDVHEIRSVVIRPTNISSLVAPILANDTLPAVFSGQTALVDITANDVSHNYNGAIDKTTIDLDPAIPGQQTTFTDAGKGTYTLNADGTVAFTPASGFTGVSVISYTASDNYGMEALVPATISVTVVTGTAPLLTIANPPAVCTGSTVNITSNTWKTQTSPGASYDYFATLTDATANTNNINATANAVSVSGTYYIRASLNGRYTVQPIVVQIYKKPSASFAGNEQSFCTNVGSSNTTTLLGSSPDVGTGKWSLVSGPDSAAIITVPYSPSCVVQNLHVGTYTFKWTVTSGPCDSSSATVKINFYAVATTAITPAGRAICNGTTDTLKGNTPLYGIGSWIQTAGPATTIDSANKPIAYVRHLAPGNSYTFKYTIANGICKSWTFYTDSSLVNTTAYAGPDQNVSTTTVHLNGNMPGTGNTGLWTLVGSPQGSAAPVITDPVNPATSVTGLSKFGKYTFQWKISNGSCNSTSVVKINYAGVLPVSFVSFNAVPGAQSSILKWQVANMDGITHFVAERSTDGIHFSTAGTVSASNDVHAYNYTDDTRLLTGTTVYYRIAGINADGTSSYSATIGLPLLSVAANKIYTWPNPFSSRIYIIVKAKDAGKATLSLYTSHGQLVSATQKQVQQGINQVQLADLQSLAGGVYMLHIQCGSDSYTQKLIKE